MHYPTAKQEREAEQMDYLSQQNADDIRALFQAGFRGVVGVQLPRVRFISAGNHVFPDGYVAKFGREEVRYEKPFAEALEEVLDSEVVLARLLDANKSNDPEKALERFRTACAEEYIRLHCDTITETMWNLRDDEYYD